MTAGKDRPPISNTITMSLISKLRKLFILEKTEKLTEAQERERAHIERRLNKFPRLRYTVNPAAHRMAIFRQNRGI